jgi:tetratricopeptide (TPR) repeat protein
MSDRISQLQRFIDEDPDDPFNWYALALEYQRTDRPRAIELFRQLIAAHSSYVPTYYQLAQALEQTGDTADAISIYDRGIIAATMADDVKAMRELTSARTALSEEMD